jgi:hypothetical protein
MTAQDVADLYAEIQRLQRALNFWMPCVPNPGEVPEGCCERLMDDSYLLAGFDGPTEKSAEELGWVKLQPPAAEYTPRDVAQILCDNSPRCDDTCTHTSNSSETQDLK